MPKFRPSNGGGAGVRRLIFTKISGPNDNHYVVGSGVGAKSVAVRQALKRRANNNADGTPCCSENK